MKGFAICSMLSNGHISTTAVPRQITSPRLLVSVVILNGSSGSVRGILLYIKVVIVDCTLDVFNGPVQYQIQQLIISLQHTCGWCV